jgi:hypothetical protein
MRLWPNFSREKGVVEHRRSRLLSQQKPLLSKRRKFVLVAVLLSLGLLTIQQLTVEQRYGAILLLALASYCLTAWSLFKELRGPAWTVNMVLPTLYPTAVALFYFLLPQAPVTQWIVLILFAISMYALLLTANIFAVASIRTIQLLRAARAVGFLLAILTSALLYHVIFSLRLSVGFVAPLLFIATYPLLLQSVWSYTMSERLKRELLYALVGAVMISELGVAIAFWLIDAPLASVMLSMVMYVVTGLFQHEMEGRLFAKTVQEFVGFATIVFVVIATAVMTRWMS